MGFIHCKHYAGRDMFLGECVCRAGINPVDRFCGGDRTGWVAKVPCLRTNETAVECDQCVYPTKEEAEADNAAFMAYVDDVLKYIGPARAAMVGSNSDGGCMDCPKCGQGLRWSKAKTNGHIHAKCDTEGCLAWME